jgi:glyoxylase-like metal-dependent hydrolase (beta-lactamase superfamily II)
MLFGDYRVSVIPDTEFRLDGGAMFGVVPRVLWERVSPPDELNRVRLNMNCVLVETPAERILIETGIGEKWTEKETRIYGIERKRSFAESLRDITDLGPEDITIVINTHLHFDHAGGNTRPEPPVSTGGLTSSSDKTIRTEPASRPIAQFPNARYLVSKTEFDHAQNPHERDRASYLPSNWQPLLDSGQLELMPEMYEAVPGLTVQQIRGHSETMQTWRLDCGGETLYGFADLIPTRHHLPPAWIMSYDLYPTETLAFKKAILPRAVRENWYCLFYHDPELPLCRLTEVDGIIQAAI